MASKRFPVIDTIDFHINKLVPENATSKSKKQALLAFPREDEDLPTQAVVSATTSATTINSTKNVNANNNTVKITNSILIPPITKANVTNNRAKEENTNKKTVNDFNNFLTLISQQQLQQITTQIM